MNLPTWALTLVGAAAAATVILLDHFTSFTLDPEHVAAILGALLGPSAVAAFHSLTGVDNESSSSDDSEDAS